VARSPQQKRQGSGAPQPQSSAGGQPGFSLSKLQGDAIGELRRHLDGRIIGLRTDRYSWWVHWRELAEYILPRRYRWLVTPNELNRGVALNQRIIDSSGSKAAQICAAGMMSGITSPGKPWFGLTIPDMDAADNSPVKLWLDEVTKRMLRVLASSNYYTSKAQQYEDLTIFGTAPMIIYEDFEDVIRCYNPCAGEYYLANSPRLTVDTMYREITMTVSQLVAEFGKDAVSDSTRRMFETGGASLGREVKVYHAIEPNDGRIGGYVVPKRFPWREAYWESGDRQNRVLRMRGFMEQPFSCPRWSLAGNDAYGRSPAMDALGAIKQLQMETREKAKGIEKTVNPPLKAHVAMKNQPLATQPGGITFVSDMSSQNSGIAPVFDGWQPRLQEMIEDLQEVRLRIDKMFFVDLFQMINSAEKEMTAFEVARRQEEKLVVLGPVIERNENEGLDPDLDRVFAIMNRRGLLPPAPPAIHGMPLQIEYVSMLAVAQRAASTSAMEQLVAFAGRLQAGDLAVAQSGAHTVWDNIDSDEMIDEYADMLGVSAKVVRASAVVAQLRDQRAKMQQAQQAMGAAQAAADSAKTMSETDVGGGQNALSAMLGNGGEPMSQAA
jgi:hypothetical protein